MFSKCQDTLVGFGAPANAGRATASRGSVRRHMRHLRRPHITARPGGARESAVTFRSRSLEGAMSQAALDVQSAVVSGGAIPSEYTCDGANHVLPLTWSDPPTETRTFTIVVHDPDAPRGDFVHWLAWNLPPTLRAVDQSTPDLAT